MAGALRQELTAQGLVEIVRARRRADGDWPPPDSRLDALEVLLLVSADSPEAEALLRDYPLQFSCLRFLLLAVGRLTLPQKLLARHLQAQTRVGNWPDLEQTALGLRLLSKLGSQRSDYRVRLALDWVFSQQRADGSYGSEAETEEVVRTLQWLGFAYQHPSLGRALDWLRSRPRAWDETTPLRRLGWLLTRGCSSLGEKGTA